MIGARSSWIGTVLLQSRRRSRVRGRSQRARARDAEHGPARATSSSRSQLGECLVDQEVAIDMLLTGANVFLELLAGPTITGQAAASSVSTACTSHPPCAAHSVHHSC